jgi:hypothetical protein
MCEHFQPSPSPPAKAHLKCPVFAEAKPSKNKNLKKKNHWLSPFFYSAANKLDLLVATS